MIQTNTAVFNNNTCCTITPHTKLHIKTVASNPRGSESNNQMYTIKAKTSSFLAHNTSKKTALSAIYQVQRDTQT